MGDEGVGKWSKMGNVNSRFMLLYYIFPNEIISLRSKRNSSKGNGDEIRGLARENLRKIVKVYNVFS